MLYVRHELHTNRIIVRLEGTLDELHARLLASTIEASPASTVAIDLTNAEFSSDAALATFVQLFSSTRRVSLRGLRPRHVGLLRAMTQFPRERVA